MRYSTVDLLAITAFVALLTWIDAPTNYPAIVGYVCLLALVAAYATMRFRGDRPHFQSIVAATGFFACSLAFWWAQLWAGYIFHHPHPDAPPYWEDGIIAEGIVYPLVYFTVYGPVAIAIALLVSATTIAILNCTCLRYVVSEN